MGKGESYLEKLLQVNIELMYNNNNNKEKSEKIGNRIVFPFNGMIDKIRNLYQQIGHCSKDCVFWTIA